MTWMFIKYSIGILFCVFLSGLGLLGVLHGDSRNLAAILIAVFVFGVYMTVYLVVSLTRTLAFFRFVKAHGLIMSNNAVWWNKNRIVKSDVPDLILSIILFVEFALGMVFMLSYGPPNALGIALLCVGGAAIIGVISLCIKCYNRGALELVFDDLPLLSGHEGRFRLYMKGRGYHNASVSYYLKCNEDGNEVYTYEFDPVSVKQTNSAFRRNYVSVDVPFLLPTNMPTTFETFVSGKKVRWSIDVSIQLSSGKKKQQSFVLPVIRK